MRQRWSVVRGRLDPTAGHEQAGSRPVLVLSNEPFNRRSGLVTVVPLTTARRDLHPWEVFIPSASCGLPVDSIALPHQIRTIASHRLVAPTYGRILDLSLRRAVADGVLRHLGFADLSALELEE